VLGCWVLEGQPLGVGAAQEQEQRVLLALQVEQMQQQV
jgi:hypothetical protein